MQYCKIQGVRLNVFEKLAEVLNLQSVPAAKAEVLDIVRPLCVFAAELPAYTKNTKRLSESALKVRNAILDARDPGNLLFHALPETCGFMPFLHNQESTSHVKRTRDFVAELQRCLEELKFALPSLQDRMCQKISKAFELSERGSAEFQATRNLLAQRCENLVVHISDLDLRAFCLRFVDNNMPQPDWLESVGSYVAAVPPSRWKDEDETLFEEKLKALAFKLRRVESVNFKPVNRADSNPSVRIAITQRDGVEKEEVIYLSIQEEQRAKELEDQVKKFLGSNKRVALSALSRLAWQFFGDRNE